MKLKGPLEASKSTQNPEFQNILTKNDDFRAKKSQRELKFPAPFKNFKNMKIMKILKNMKNTEKYKKYEKCNISDEHLKWTP